jgi:predicted nucleic acid-binding protein
MIYCDTSLLIAAFAPEARSGEIQQWLFDRSGEIAVSWWVHTEFASAIAIKGRTGALNDDERRRVMAAWHAESASFVLLPVERRHFEEAAEMTLRPDMPLRGGDALHLAIARTNGLKLATLDRELAASAEREGMGTSL